VGEDRGVGGHPGDIAAADQLFEVPRLDAGAREVVEPDADTGLGELGCGGAHAFSLRLSCAAWTTASAVIPNFANRVLWSAEAPKGSMPIERPRSPTMARQPSTEPASTETRAVTDAGSTESR